MDDGSPPDLPRDFDGLRALILSRRQSLPKRIAQVAAYALDNPDEIAFGTAASIAEASGVQPSTLVRFAQHLGFDGFTSLQTVFRGRLRERNSSYEERLAALRADVGGNGAHHRILEGFLTASGTSLDLMARSIDAAALDSAIAALSEAETVYILARRRSYPVASYMGYALGKLGVRNQLVESAAGLAPEILSFATKRDVAFAVSFSPYAPETIEETRVLSERGVPVVAVTDSAFSPLVQFATIWFEVAEADFGGFRTLSATMALAMTLAVGVGDTRRGRKPARPRARTQTAIA
ncbi:RpiR family transcriptional regulator [Bosea sp. AAP35]|uniref:MurR/RpiR family transcriptional regulator n=1 Tax=Bosea sp. AAP35 TaxID=1523417 RepID=UPI0006B9EF15|nr:MurR/RpiR family transcriptional regulator [Bosea sp. AAP35]KPF73154.1 RpiR family transcriptional regulator [Bosea sp. AAP35]